MTANGWFQILFYLLVILLLTKPIGVFMTRVFNREKTFLDALLRPVEKLVYRLTGVDEHREMRWTEYAIAMLAFSVQSSRGSGLISRAHRGNRPWGNRRRRNSALERSIATPDGSPEGSPPLPSGIDATPRSSW